MIAGRSRRASCILASAPFIAPTRPPISTSAWKPAKPIGASSARRCKARRHSDALAPQDGLYTLAERGSDGEKLRVIGSIQSLIVAPQDPAALLDVLTDPRIRIVTLTITEKAYLRDAAGDLDAAHPGIVADLANPASPQTAHGFLVEALARRRASGVAPFTILSCDNLPANGKTLHRLLVQFAGLRDADTEAACRRGCRVSLQHGRPHRAGDHGWRPRARLAGARRRGSLAGDDGAVPAMGDRGRIFRRDGRTGKSSA